jgi:hypothetical protein
VSSSDPFRSDAVNLLTLRFAEDYDEISRLLAAPWIRYAGAIYLFAIGVVTIAADWLRAGAIGIEATSLVGFSLIALAAWSFQPARASQRKARDAWTPGVLRVREDGLLSEGDGGSTFYRWSSIVGVRRLGRFGAIDVVDRTVIVVEAGEDDTARLRALVLSHVTMRGTRTLARALMPALVALYVLLSSLALFFVR